MTLEELEDVLARPSEADCAALAALPGDIVVIGAGGKMGPSLVRRAMRAAPGKRVFAVARSPIPDIDTITVDLLDRKQLSRLPGAANVIFMAGRKFGSAGAACLTWATNALLPAIIAERYEASRIVAFSTGNVYPFVPVGSPATERTPTAPVGEYAQSALARERVFEYFSERHDTAVTLLRLNYAVEPRYGVLLDIGERVYARHQVDLTMGHVNVIWQGDANSAALRALCLAESPPRVMNLTGPETLQVRWIANQFAARFGVEPVFEGSEAETALLSDASAFWAWFGTPHFTVPQVIDMIADWISAGGPTLRKPTHFQTRSGQF